MGKLSKGKRDKNHSYIDKYIREIELELHLQFGHNRDRLIYKGIVVDTIPEKYLVKLEKQLRQRGYWVDIYRKGMIHVVEIRFPKEWEDYHL